MTSAGAGLVLLAFAAALSAPGEATRPAADTARPPAREDIEKQVRADAAERTKASESDVRVVEFEERTWPDAGLGCMARKGVAEPTPVPGYRIVVAAGDSRFEYHADKGGRYLRCDRPAKPVGPVSR